jgi:hypothetical protein
MHWRREAATGRRRAAGGGVLVATFPCTQKIHGRGGRGFPDDPAWSALVMRRRGGGDRAVCMRQSGRREQHRFAVAANGVNRAAGKAPAFSMIGDGRAAAKRPIGRRRRATRSTQWFKPCLSGWLTFARSPLWLFRAMLSCLVWRSEIFVILGEHAFVFRKGLAHTG